MSDIDTSAEAVDRLAAGATSEAWEVDAAATLRALLRERDEARAARTQAIREMCEQARVAGSWQGIADGKDIIIRQLEAERDEARALIEEMRAPYAIICKREWQAGAEAMRDICAKTASERGAWASNDMDAESLVDRLEANGRMEMAGEVFDAIRALPIPERPE